MPTILVVDDSSVDRRVVGGLLERQAGWKIDYANNGAEALRHLERVPADVVLTDLIMPEMDGLELVTSVKELHPLIPVILMTSKGNEEIAVKALHMGAASYAPKSTLPRTLVQTIQMVLSVASQQRNEARLCKFMIESECAFVLENDSSLIPALIGLLQDDAQRIGVCDKTDRVRVGVALDEALVNALFHGNLEISSRLRDDDYDEYMRQIHLRGKAEPYCRRRIHVFAKMSPQQATFTIRDEGPGFDPGVLPDPLNPANLENLSGRGILLMRTFMDEVLYNETGNEVTLIKRPAPVCADVNGKCA